MEIPQMLDAQGGVPRGDSCLGLSSEVMLDGKTGLVVGLDSRRYIEARDPDSMACAGIVPASMPPGGPDDLMLAVAWGAGPDGADVGELDDSYVRTWVPAAGLVRTSTWVPDGDR